MSFLPCAVPKVKQQIGSAGAKERNKEIKWHVKKSAQAEFSSVGLNKLQ